MLFYLLFATDVVVVITVTSFFIALFQSDFFNFFQNLTFL